MPTVFPADEVAPEEDLLQVVYDKRPLAVEVSRGRRRRMTCTQHAALATAPPSGRPARACLPACAGVRSGGPAVTCLPDSNPPSLPARCALSGRALMSLGSGSRASGRRCLPAPTCCRRRCGQSATRWRRGWACRASLWGEAPAAAGTRGHPHFAVYPSNPSSPLAMHPRVPTALLFQPSTPCAIAHSLLGHCRFDYPCQVLTAPCCSVARPAAGRALA